MTFAIMMFRTLIKPFVPNGLIPSIHDNSPDLAGSLPVLKGFYLFLPISLFPPFFQLHVFRNFFQTSSASQSKVHNLSTSTDKVVIVQK